MAVLLTACGGGGGASDSAASDTAGSARQANGGATADFGTPAQAPDADGASTSVKTAATVIERSVIATGSIRLTTRHLADGRQDSISLVTGLGGHVADEQSVSDRHGRLNRVDLTLRVPSTSFEQALDGLARLGTVRHREQSVEDVTTQVIDNETRVKAQEASIASMEKLLAKATTVAEILSIEDQLSRRQADLDSLKQQQKWLSDQTSLSTIQLSLTEPVAAATDHASGFLAGLEGGWHALGRTALALGTAVGALLPFAVVLGLVGVPLWIGSRRRRAPLTTPPATEA